LLAPKPSPTNWKSSTSSSDEKQTYRRGCPLWPSISFCVRAGGPRTRFDIAIADGRIVEIAERIVADAPAKELAGRLLIAGFIASHIHLDKSRTLGRCDCRNSALEEAIASVAAAKPVGEKGIKPTLRLEPVGDKRANQLEKGKHRVG